MLLNSVNIILKTKREAFKILMETPACNLDLIRRTATDIRDPNPLTSTMEQMCRKFPITAKKKQVEEYKIPIQLLSNQTDNHNRDRILCKKEAVDWWVEEAPLPTEEQMKVIDVLYKFPRKEVSDYFGIDWRNGSLRYAPVMMSKEVVKTKAPLANIPKNIQKHLILQTLLPDSTVRYEATNPEFEETMREIVEANLSTKMSFLTQVHVILQHIDSKPRMQPMTYGSSDETGVFRYTMSQSRFAIRGITVPVNKRSNEMTQLLVKLSQACQAAVSLGFSVEDVQQSARVTTLDGILIPTLLHEWDDPQRVSLQYLFCILGHKVSMSSKLRNVMFYPCPTDVRVRVRSSTTKGGYHFGEYVGRETVNYSYEDVRGQFVRAGLNNGNINHNESLRRIAHETRPRDHRRVLQMEFFWIQSLKQSCS